MSIGNFNPIWGISLKEPPEEVVEELRKLIHQYPHKAFAILNTEVLNPRWFMLALERIIP